MGTLTDSVVSAFLTRTYPPGMQWEELQGGFSGARIFRIKFPTAAGDQTEVLKCHSEQSILAEEMGIQLFAEAPFAVQLIGKVELGVGRFALRLEDCGKDVDTLKDVVLRVMDCEGEAGTDEELVLEACCQILGILNSHHSQEPSPKVRNRGLQLSDRQSDSPGILAWMMQRSTAKPVMLSAISQDVLDGRGPFNGLGAQRQAVECVYKKWGARSFSGMEELEDAARNIYRTSDMHMAACLGHGDFSAANVLVAVDQVRVIDFDKAALVKPRWSDWANMAIFFLTVYLTLPVPVHHVAQWPSILPEPSLNKIGVWLTGRTDCTEVGKRLLQLIGAKPDASCPVDDLTVSFHDTLQGRLRHRLADNETAFWDGMGQARRLAKWFCGRIAGSDAAGPEISGRYKWMFTILEQFADFADKHSHPGERLPMLFLLFDSALQKMKFPALSPNQKAFVAEVLPILAKYLLPQYYGCFDTRASKHEADNSQLAIRTELLVSTDGTPTSFLVARVMKSDLNATHKLIFPCFGNFAAGEQLDAAAGDISLIDVVVKEECLDKFLMLAIDNARHSCSEDNCLRFELWQQINEPGRFILFKVYTTAEAARQHRESEHYKNYDADVKEVLLTRRTARRFLLRNSACETCPTSLKETQMSSG